MKAILALATLALTSQVFAAAATTAKVKPTPDTVKPSVIEHVFILQKETAEQPAIRLIQADNGGSTDIGAMMAPSRLYMTIHQDGEMFDINANYLIAPGATEVRVVKFENGVASITFESKSESLKDVKHAMKIDVKAALKEIKSAQADFGDDYSPKAAVTTEEATR